MILTNFIKSFVMGMLIWSGSASANTSYNFADFTLSSSNTFSAIVTTNINGSFSDALEIQNILNSSRYTAALFSHTELVSHMDNSNAMWELSLTEADRVMLTIDSSQMKLSFFTGDSEIGSGALLLRSSDMRSVLQFRQENNVTDYNFVDYTFDAVVTANTYLPYHTPFAFPVVTAIPEPVSAWLVLAGLNLIWLRRKSA